ncbi:MAG: hypothetical protein ACE5R4_13360, partial [Armatimonadota bacterium]
MRGYRGLGPMLLCAMTAAGLIALVALAGQGRAQTAPILASRSRLGMNLAGLSDWNTELPFVDVFRLSRKWISQRQGEGWGKGPELELDEHGWVKRLEPDCWAETPLCTISGGHYPSGQYVCLYEGKGEIEFWNITREVSREPGRIVVEVDSGKGAFWLRIKSLEPDNYIRDIRVVMPGFEGRYEEEPFHPDFLARWQEFNTFRFMDWMRTNGSKVQTWDDRPKMDDATWTVKGAPLEVMIDLCNRLDVNPWFCMPHLADDDYVRRFAAQVKRELEPPLTVYVEYSNEIWNGMFAQTRYAGEKGLALGFGDKPWEAGWRYSAYRSVQMFRLWENVFGGRDRLVRVISTQAANPYVSERKLEFQDAYKECDALGVAPYFSLNLSPRSDPSSDEVSEWTVKQVLDHLEQVSLPRAIEHIRRQKQVADKYGLRLVAYEAGQHAVGVGGGENNEALTALLHAANRDERMGGLY